MELKELRHGAYTVTIEGQPLKLRCDLNALDYLERTCGGLEKAAAAEDMATRKHFLRAFLLCNYDNADAMDSGRLSELLPSLYQVGQWFDAETLAAVCLELYNIALEQSAPEGEQRPGEQMAAMAAAAIGALLKLCGQASFTEALRNFGFAPQGKSSRASQNTLR